MLKMDRWIVEHRQARRKAVCSLVGAADVHCMQPNLCVTLVGRLLVERRV